MLFYTVTGWIYFREPNGKYITLVKGQETPGCNPLIHYAGSKEIPLQKNAAEKLVPELRAKMPDLIQEYIRSGQWHILEESFCLGPGSTIIYRNQELSNG